MGMDTIEEPTVVGVKISSGIADSATTVGNPPRAPYNFQIGQAPGPGVVNPDAFGLTIQVPALTLLDDKKGELKGNSVAVSAWCQGSDMSDFANIGTDTISGKRTAAGIWGGTFKESWCNNPAWVLFDLLTHPRRGLGRKIPIEG